MKSQNNHRRFEFSRIVALAAVALLISSLLAPTLAGVMVQRAGESYIAWEAEDYDTYTQVTSPGSWNIVSGADASGGQALQAGGTVYEPPGGGIADYALQFSEQGTYRLYFRIKESNDSMFRSPDFDLPPNDPPNRHLPLYSTYTWYNDSGVPAGRYLVEPGDIGSSLGFSVGSRESGFHVDRFVMSTNTNLSGEALDQLFNWDVVITHATSDGA